MRPEDGKTPVDAAGEDIASQVYATLRRDHAGKKLARRIKPRVAIHRLPIKSAGRGLISGDGALHA